MMKRLSRALTSLHRTLMCEPRTEGKNKVVVVHRPSDTLRGDGLAGTRSHNTSMDPRVDPTRGENYRLQLDCQVTNYALPNSNDVAYSHKAYAQGCPLHPDCSAGSNHLALSAAPGVFVPDLLSLSWFGGHSWLRSGLTVHKQI